MRPRAGGAPGTGSAWTLLVLVAAVGLTRPLLPVDETRYAAVAWEMWSRGEFLVPYLNGEPYAHKPPLLFWLIHVGWAAFGVDAWWLRVLPALAAAGTLAATTALARELWPGRPALPALTGMALVATGPFVYFVSALMFDMLLALFVALAFLGVARARRSGGLRRGLALFAFGIAGGLLAKGPVMLLHALPVALAAPWWWRDAAVSWRRWYGGLAFAVLAAALPVLAWALAASAQAGEAYRDAIFWGQTAGRIVHSFAHRAPAWYYLAWLPLLLLPWSLWPRCWPREARALAHDGAVRFVLGAALPVLIGFSLVSGKQVQYLLPELGLFALLLARVLDDSCGGRWARLAPALVLAGCGVAAAVAAAVGSSRLGGLDDAWALAVAGAVPLAAALWLLAHGRVCTDADVVAAVRRVAVASVATAAAVLTGFTFAMREPYDLHATALRLAAYERERRPVAIGAGHHGQWTFAGRLRRPLVEVPPQQVSDWLASHPTGRALLVLRRAEEVPAGLHTEDLRRHRGGRLAIVSRDPDRE